MTTPPYESWLKRYALYFAWIVTLVATGGSLYFSEIKGFIPCDLCWYQRIFMYPQVIILGIATYRGDRNIIKYLLPINIIGLAISIFHNFEIWFPKVGELVPCRSGIPCNFDYLNWFGFLTIPMMAMIAFVLVIVFLLLARQSNEDEEANEN
ncbi:disulfide oxidoreductase [Paenibacillus algorifonticola]|uniref:disulfide oxidoreductase n=1 Tax=Paenibacillus algorifonticola TaxID=684063 RepID=UPI003D299A78